MAVPKIRSEGVVYLPDSGEREPMSVVWTTLPGISFLLPVIGHAGITDSAGITFDFSGPYQVTVGSLMCGPAQRVWTLDPTRIYNLNGKETPVEAYDDAVVEGACAYGKRFHNIFCDNCHCHVAMTLNKLEYEGRDDWNQVRVFMNVWLKGKWVRRREAAFVFGPFVVLLLVLLGVFLFVGLRNG